MEQPEIELPIDFETEFVGASRIMKGVYSYVYVRIPFHHAMTVVDERALQVRINMLTIILN